MAKLKKKKLQSGGDMSSITNMLGSGGGGGTPTAGIAKMIGSLGKGNQVSRLEKNPEQVAKIKGMQESVASMIPYGSEVMAANKLIGGMMLSPDKDGINRASYGSQLAYNVTPLGQLDRFGKGVSKLMDGDIKGGLNTIANPLSFKKDNDTLKKRLDDERNKAAFDSQQQSYMAKLANKTSELKEVPSMQTGGNLPITKYKGNTHKEGGIDIDIAEVESDEVLWDKGNGEKHVFSQYLTNKDKKPFAKIAEKIKDKYKLRRYDAIDKKQANLELSDLEKEEKIAKEIDAQKRDILGYSDGSPYSDEDELEIRSNNITMNGTSKDLMLIPDNDEPIMAKGNSGEYSFPNSSKVTEVPIDKMAKLKVKPKAQTSTTIVTQGGANKFYKDEEFSRDTVPSINNIKLDTGFEDVTGYVTDAKSNTKYAAKELQKAKVSSGPIVKTTLSNKDYIQQMINSTLKTGREVSRKAFDDKGWEEYQAGVNSLREKKAYVQEQTKESPPEPAIIYPPDKPEILEPELTPDEYETQEIPEAGYDWRKAARFVSPAARGLGALWLSKQKLKYKQAPPHLEEHNRVDINPMIANAKAAYSTADRNANFLSDSGSRLAAKLAVGSARSRDIGAEISKAEISDSDRWQSVENRNTDRLNTFEMYNNDIGNKSAYDNMELKKDALGLGIDAATETSNLIQADLLADARNKNAMRMAMLSGTNDYSFAQINDDGDMIKVFNGTNEGTDGYGNSYILENGKWKKKVPVGTNQINESQQTKSGASLSSRFKTFVNKPI